MFFGVFLGFVYLRPGVAGVPGGRPLARMPAILEAGFGGGFLGGAVFHLEPGKSLAGPGLGRPLQVLDVRDRGSKFAIR